MLNSIDDANVDKEKLLLELIEEISNQNFHDDNQKKKDWIKRLGCVYCDGFRHSYSEISKYLQLNVFISEKKESRDILGENLNDIKSELLKTNDLDVKDSKCLYEGFNKLSDHINLELVRYNYVEKRVLEAQLDNAPNNINNQIEENVRKAIPDLDKLRAQISFAKIAADKVEKLEDTINSRMESNNVSSITTLTIFSAVILTFSGGITFSSGVFSGLSDVSAYRLVFTVGLVGFILFNTVFALLYLVAKMTNKQIETRCKYMTYSADATTYKCCGKGYCTKKYSTVSFLCKLLRKYLYVFVIDIILIFVMYADYILWSCAGVLSVNTALLIILPYIIVLLVCIIVSRTRARLQKERVREMNKVTILNEILYPSESKFSRAFRKNWFVDRKSLYEEFLEYYEIKCDDISFENADKLLDEFVIKKDGEGSLIQKYVSFNEGKSNKECYNILIKEFVEYISNLRVDKCAD